MKAVPSGSERLSEAACSAVVAAAVPTSQDAVRASAAAPAGSARIPDGVRSTLGVCGAGSG